ncbi:zinc finger protein 462 [Dicentrarchus labrax]|uniref:C2H2-type domain-containing protein n=1 Tax=Dicentrarchus labrax TaxID=13489 RepID=A0A8C4I4A5_DICLA|nr:zinc finger protein 462 [Dicentrarchus labrax]XP_051278424.1 zinc finger protein 462 [Dicentrarchus labrax]
MQKDSISTSGHVIYNQAQTQEPSIKSFQCSHCTLLFKSKVYLFEHLNKVHGFDVDVALRDAGLKNAGTTKASTDNESNSSGDHFECQHCDFKARSRDVLNEHDKHCQNKTEDQNVIGNLISSENHNTKNPSTDQIKEAAGARAISSTLSVTSTSKTKCTLISSKDVKTYKRPLQTITKYFVSSSGSTGKSPVKLTDSTVLLDGTKETLVLQESPQDSSPNSSGVFKVTAKPTIDISGCKSDRFLLRDQLLVSDLRAPKPEEQYEGTVPSNVGKRTNNESSKGPPAKKAKEETKRREKADASQQQQQQSSSNTEFSFEFSEDEEEKKANLVNGDMKSPKVYFCKHCDYTDVSIRLVSTHYQNNHPYVRYKTVYIQEPSDQSATFRCLECPVEFFSVADLKRHYTENHPEAPNVFTMQSSELRLLFKCFVCQFTTTALKTLIKHYKQTHPTHKVDNSLMYCRYSVTSCQEESSQSNTSKKAPSPERPQGLESAREPSKEVKNAPPPQHPSSKRAEGALYHCNNCNFSHKSAVGLHVHYQKNHPDEAVTIDTIKQSARATTSQMMPEKSPDSVTTVEKSTSQKNTSGPYEGTRNQADLSQQNISLSLRNPKATPEASKTRSESTKTEGKKVEFSEDKSKQVKRPTKRIMEMSAVMDSLSSSSTNKLFYCQFCGYSSTNIKSVVSHHNSKHAAQEPTDIEEILCHSAKVQKKKLQREAKASKRAASSDSKTSKQVEERSEKELQHKDNEAADSLAMGFNAYACAENLFYCQKCNYGNPSVIGVLSHQAKVHQSINSSRDCIIEHTASVRDQIEKSKSQAKELSFSTHLPLPLMNESDGPAFFCHFCNYRHRTVHEVLRHYFKIHRGFLVTGEQVRLYTNMVLNQTQTIANQEVRHASLGEKEDEQDKTKKLVKVSASQTQRTLHCHRCPYSTQYVYLLRRHMWKIHKANRSVTEVLKVCFKRGTLQTGYHCDLCVFSHKKAAAVYNHYQEQHPGRRPSLQYVTTRLYVGPDASPPKKKKPQIKNTDRGSDGDDTDASLRAQRSGQNETKMYSCRACSFKGSSKSDIACHYRAVHPWSVKEDGSVLDVLNSKKPGANRQVQDHNEMPLTFDTYQAPLEFENSPGSSHEATASPATFKCVYCPAKFPSQRGLNTHCGMKHQDALAENLDEQQEEQVQTQTRVHVFKCPHCTYVNTNYHGVLTHCQMRHPVLASRADSFYVDEAHVRKWEHCLKRKGHGIRLSGYMCKTCPEIYATLEKLNKHREQGHKGTVANAVANTPQSAPKPSAMSKKKQYKALSNQGTVSKASFLSKKTYAVIKCQYCSYGCSTQLALSRHMHVRHQNASVSKVQDSLYKCALCSSSYFRKKRLGSHYANKHGKEAFLKYCAPLFTQVTPATTVPDRPLTQQPDNNSEDMTTEDNKMLVYRCPCCPYMNASYHGTLTHCQMKHPDIVARADELQTEEVLVTNIVSCTMGKGSNTRGYVCKKCPQIHVSLKKLKNHFERDHGQAMATASEHPVQNEAEKQPAHGSQGSVLEAVSPIENQTSAVSTTETGLSHDLGTLETCQPSTVPNKVFLYKCHICTYIGSCRRYLHCHYKNTHRLDALTTHKLLQKYNKYKHKASNLPEAESEESANVKCKMCQNLTFDSSQLLIDHYSTFHSSDCTLDFIVLSQASKKSTGLYICALCKKQMNGIRKLCDHLDRHREQRKKMAEAAERTPSLAITTAPEAKSIELCRQDELPIFETVAELAQWNVTPTETFTLPTSPLLSPSKHADLEQPELDPREDEHTCKQCGRKFMSLKGLRSHERSHAALAAIKKMDNVSTSALKHNINKYIIYKAGTIRPFLCSFCSYRTTVMGLWRSHFMKKHHDVLMDTAESDYQDEESAERADKDPPNLSEELNNLSELDEELEITEKSYLEPPDVQRQLNHYNLMAQAGAALKVNVQETSLPENSLLHCEVCNFNTGHLSSIRRHYLRTHGKKILRCKDCNFVTGFRKTLEMHIQTGHSTCQSEPTHQKDLRCPFCLYQTKNKNNMIDHIVLHREERVVPIEVRRSKLSRCLQGIVFRCHKCTFTSGSAENLRLHMMRHDDVKPYKCRLCYFDCTRLTDLEAHLSDKHQVVRNHELVGQISLDQLEVMVGMPEEDGCLSNLERHSNDREDVRTEKFVSNFNEVPHETQAKNPAENNNMENITLQINEAYQNQEQDGKNGNEENPAESSVLDLQDESTTPNTTVQQKHEQDPQEQAEIIFLPDSARRQKIENTAEQNVGGGNSTDIQLEDRNCPEKERQTNENQAQPKLRDGEDSSITLTQQKEQAAEGSSTTYGRVAEKAQSHKLHIKTLKHRTLNFEARIENDILRHILLLDKESSNTLAHNRKNQVNTEDISASAKTNHRLANNNRAPESFTVERHLLTIKPNCGQLKISHKEILGVSFTKCKEDQVKNQKNSEEVRDPYGEMPVLENEYLKEEMQPLCKEEDKNDDGEQKQDREMIAEDNEKESENPHVPKGETTVLDGAATEEKLFTCEFCGRNLTNNFELQRHIVRHGI